jgi:hypothetical protein
VSVADGRDRSANGNYRPAADEATRGFDTQERTFIATLEVALPRLK